MSEKAAVDAQRLFFAIWPSDALRRRIEADTREPVRQSGGRKVPVQNLHVTVLFIGQVPLPQVAAVMEAGAQAQGASFELSLDKVESWPESKVLCLTGERAPAALAQLADRLRFSLLEQQFRLREQLLRPHVTLARDVSRRCEPIAVPALRWRVDEFVLVDSQRTRHGSQYAVMARWPLSAPIAAETARTRR